MNPVNGMRPVHPGEILSQELDALGLSIDELSKKLRVPKDRITKILNSHCDVREDMALRLSGYFCTTPRLWLNLQRSWELRRARIRSGCETAQSLGPEKNAA
ncbi:MAG: HigA family addiction module antitoxin [Candidatus Dadabacteria bacterium]|nr:HigA family addiction module antitoxin [Candidatus Dadabacteria bacterium]MDE0520071.1 HigA family addiction module antitoxin [Candidatus Dadabacteria bacterium]MDE0663548.1 HigA family addiction module antitoxin [Candidatus Dadabacteria bacterium]